MNPLDALTNFGFTTIESLIYADLLKNSPSTGYKLAKSIGKAPANIYQSLKTLSEKGAVSQIIEKGSTPTYIPIPPAQLMSSIRNRFDTQYIEALDSLEKANSSPDDECVYQLRSVEQVLDRTRAMLSAAKEYAIFDMFPFVLDLFQNDIAMARDRGVVVAGIAYRASDAGDLMPLNSEASDLVEQRWPGQGLILVTDAKEHLIAQLSRDMRDVLSAVYSDSMLISCVMHSAFAADLRLVSLRDDPSDRLKILSLQQSVPLGMRLLTERYAGKLGHNKST